MPPLEYLDAIQSRIPLFLAKLPVGTQVSLDVMPESINLVIHRDRQWLQEFAFFTNSYGVLDYCPVFRQG